MPIGKRVRYKGWVPWTPALLATQLWFDASDPATITQAGGLVSQWNDKSGNNNHATQGVNANKPSIGLYQLNGLDMLTMYSNPATTTRFMTLGSTASVRAAYGVCSVNSPGVGVIASFGGVAGVNPNAEFFARKVADQISFDGLQTIMTGKYALNGGAYSGFARNHTDAAVTGAILLSGVFNSQVNLGQILGRNSLGASHDATNTSMAEFLWTAAELSSYDRQLVEGYLAWKWGLQGSLPANHQWAGGPPRIPRVA